MMLPLQSMELFYWKVIHLPSKLTLNIFIMRRGGGKDDDFAAQTMDRANMMALDDLADSTDRLLQHTKTLHGQIRSDVERLDSVLYTGSNANDMMAKGRQFVKSITDDPTGIGIMKIALVTFTILCTLYFGGKLLYILFFRKK